MTVGLHNQNMALQTASKMVDSQLARAEELAEMGRSVSKTERGN